jgi:hypothetical protein
MVSVVAPPKKQFAIGAPDLSPAKLADSRSNGIPFSSCSGTYQSSMCRGPRDDFQLSKNRLIRSEAGVPHVSVPDDLLPSKNCLVRFPGDFARDPSVLNPNNVQSQKHRLIRSAFEAPHQAARRACAGSRQRTFVVCGIGSILPRAPSGSRSQQGEKQKPPNQLTLGNTTI